MYFKYKISYYLKFLSVNTQIIMEYISFVTISNSSSLNLRIFIEIKYDDHFYG